MVVLEHEPTITRPLTSRRNIWFGFCVLALLLLAVADLQVWAAIVMVVAAALAAPRLRPSPSRAVDRTDLLVVSGLYVAVVVAFRVAFTVFITDNVLGLFLCFAAGLLLGVIGPVAYQVWVRGRDLRSLGIGAHQWRATLAMGLVLAAVQFARRRAVRGHLLPGVHPRPPRGQPRPRAGCHRRRGALRGLPRRVRDGPERDVVPPRPRSPLREVAPGADGPAALRRVASLDPARGDRSRSLGAPARLEGLGPGCLPFRGWTRRARVDARTPGTATVSRWTRHGAWTSGSRAPHSTRGAGRAGTVGRRAVPRADSSGRRTRTPPARGPRPS